ncbi:MAG: bifunctional 5,10-methylene-tetrahydrofolate dehydrogenase/5,10-methylene-tetrahydrofolate cyclohydrolase [uncultured bacterium]|nr:MAG: bifunctional 5,10-methylene-tetrahydrofolate dehydrogenase/5,10-methylene-tetrahydrofolate cyclohydrolase [uncultured bacterium]
MNILEGKTVSANILADLKEKIAKEKKAPGLAVILVGQNKASEIYVGLKEKRAKEIGINFSLFRFNENSEEEEIIQKIKDLNRDENINGIIVQLPIAEKFNTQRIINEIDVKKDVDGFSVSDKSGKLEPVFPKAIIVLLESGKKNIFGKYAVVIANSEKFGSVMQKALEKKRVKAEYILRGDIENNLEKIKNADIVVTAVGEKKLIKGNMLKNGAMVIDGGIVEENGKVLGDADFESMKNREGFISPVPGGVGPVTIACLLENVYIAYKQQSKIL